VEPRPGKWIHHIVIEKEADFDNKVQGWIAEAYRLGNRKKNNKTR